MRLSRFTRRLLLTSILFLIYVTNKNIKLIKSLYHHPKQNTCTSSSSNSPRSIYTNLDYLTNHTLLVRIHDNDGEEFKFTRNNRRAILYANLTISKKDEYKINSETDSIIPNRIIFFSYGKFKNLHYLCSVESAARHNPTHKIFVFVDSVDEFLNVARNWLNKIDFLKRLNVLKLDYSEIFVNTPLERWYLDGSFKKSKWPLQNLGNAFRLAALYKIGGTYIDMVYFFNLGYHYSEFIDYKIQLSFGC